MGRKRTASYKRKRRARNKARLQALKNMPRDPNRPSRPCRVQFFQRRNQLVFDFTFSGTLMNCDPETGKALSQPTGGDDE